MTPARWLQLLTGVLALVESGGRAYQRVQQLYKDADTPPTDAELESFATALREEAMDRWNAQRDQ